jgi:hypothetical protein
MEISAIEREYVYTEATVICSLNRSATTAHSKGFAPRLLKVPPRKWPENCLKITENEVFHVSPKWDFLSTAKKRV